MSEVSVEDIEARVREVGPVFESARNEMARVLVGQRYMVDRLLIGLLANGHVLIEGVPGLAKTTAVKALAGSLSLQFSRIQFTPDLLPADLIGTQIYEPKTGDFSTRLGPTFANVVLADEINRAPPKVQSALLEAMGEHQVTVGLKTRSSKREPIRFPRPRPTGSCSSSTSDIQASTRKSRSCRCLESLLPSSPLWPPRPT